MANISRHMEFKCLREVKGTWILQKFLHNSEKKNLVCNSPKKPIYQSAGHQAVKRVKK